MCPKKDPLRDQRPAGVQSVGLENLAQKETYVHKQNKSQHRPVRRASSCGVCVSICGQGSSWQSAPVAGSARLAPLDRLEMLLFVQRPAVTNSRIQHAKHVHADPICVLLTLVPLRIRTCSLGKHNGNWASHMPSPDHMLPKIVPARWACRTAEQLLRVSLHHAQHVDLDSLAKASIAVKNKYRQPRPRLASFLVLLRARPRT